MATRQITGSKEMIDILNGFGHSASYDTIVRFDTVLATLNSTRDHVVPAELIPCVPTTVYDNQDYCEETKSGKGQTHVAAGKSIQRVYGTLIETANKPKISLSVHLNGIKIFYLFSIWEIDHLHL